MPASDQSFNEIVESPFTDYDIIFFGGKCNGDVEISLLDGESPVSAIHFFNSTGPLPDDTYSSGMIFLYTYINTLDAVIHELEQAVQKNISYDPGLSLAMLKLK